MRVDDDLLRGAEAVPRDLLEGLVELGAGPAPTPSAALQLFLAEQLVADLPAPRAAVAVSADVVPALPPAPARPGRRRLAGRVASLGLMAKVLLGSGAALAGVTGAGAAGALPPVLQDAWDGVAGAHGGSGKDGPAEPAASPNAPVAPSGAGPAPAVAPAAGSGAARPVPVQQQPATLGGAVSDVPAAGTRPAPATHEVTEAQADAAQPDAPAVEDAAAEPPPPPSPQTAEEQTPTDAGTTSGDGWTPVPDEPTSAPSDGSTSAPEDARTWESDQPASAPPDSVPTDTHTGSGTTGGGSSGSGSGSGGW